MPTPVRLRLTARDRGKLRDGHRLQVKLGFGPYERVVVVAVSEAVYTPTPALREEELTVVLPAELLADGGQLTVSLRLWGPLFARRDLVLVMAP